MNFSRFQKIFLLLMVMPSVFSLARTDICFSKDFQEISGISNYSKYFDAEHFFSAGSCEDERGEHSTSCTCVCHSSSYLLTEKFVVGPYLARVLRIEDCLPLESIDPSFIGPPPKII